MFVTDHHRKRERLSHCLRIWQSKRIRHSGNDCLHGGLALKMVQNDIPEGCDTVGIGINAKHIKASPIGSKITFTSTVSAIDGKKISYSIEAKDEKGETIGSPLTTDSSWTKNDS